MEFRRYGGTFASDGPAYARFLEFRGLSVLTTFLFSVFLWHVEETIAIFIVLCGAFYLVIGILSEYFPRVIFSLVVVLGSIAEVLIWPYVNAENNSSYSSPYSYLYSRARISEAAVYVFIAYNFIIVVAAIFGLKTANKYSQQDAAKDTAPQL